MVADFVPPYYSIFSIRNFGIKNSPHSALSTKPYKNSAIVTISILHVLFIPGEFY